MYRLIVALIFAVVFLVVGSPAVHAADTYVVPIVIGSETYTLTITVEGSSIIKVSANSDAVQVGTPTAVKAASQSGATADIDTLKASAETISYDELFRHNEKYVGTVVRYVGEVLQVQTKSCLVCDNPGYVLRVAVTKGDFGIWDDPIWVEYEGAERFLEEDIVTVWGTVEGLQDYTAVLGNQVTIPKIKAIDVVLGEGAVPAPAATATASTTDTGAADGPVANRNANLRGGPGTSYPVVGGVKSGQALDVVARNQDGSWLQLEDGPWIAAFLVDNAPATGDLPEAEEIPEAPAAAPAGGASAAAPAVAAGGSGVVGIGDELQGSGWRFKVAEVHKRKAVYFYGDAYVAMGHFLVVIIEAVNEQSGTDYFDRNIDPYLTDDAGKVYQQSGSGTVHAKWQYGGLASTYTDVNPGNFVRIAMAFDVPDNVGHIMLGTDLPNKIDLGNFAAMESEDS
ncbi:MAG: SH3 domain-containing protein [Caldilineaceae bacterium]|nr:SH3 domain-containing protein [Caldilineaceae bacterium]